MIESVIAVCALQITLGGVEATLSRREFFRKEHLSQQKWKTALSSVIDLSGVNVSFILDQSTNP
jgi:hypothetical protein